MIRFYKLYWEYIWHAHPQIFLETCFGFLLSSANSLNILQWSKTILVFLSDHEGFLVLYVWEALLYSDHCENNNKKMFSYLFVLAWICFVLYVLCIVDIHIRAGITWWTVVFIWVLRVIFHISTTQKSHILWCFQNQYSLN